MRKLKILTVGSLIAVFSILGAGAVSAAAPNPPNCMGKDMGLWAREGSTPTTGPGQFESGSGWGQFTAENAQQDDPFGQETWGHAMTAHLAGAFSEFPGVTCELPG